MQLSEHGAQFIAHFEGFRSHLYDDPHGNCTIGYGHLVHMGPCNGSEPEQFKKGISEQQAIDLLREQAAGFAKQVDQMVTVPLDQERFDVLVDFVYNLGPGTLEQSTLLKDLNDKDYGAVPAQLERFDHAGLQVLPGLEVRRAAEAKLWETRQYPKF